MARGTLASAWTRRGTIGTGIAGIAAMVVSACGAGGDTAAKPASTPAPAAPTKAPAASEPTKAAVAPPASAVKGFANPNLLVSVEWLMQHQADAGLVVVDARPSADYEKGHLAGAVNLPVVETFDPAQPKNLPDTPAKLEALFGSKGIGNESKVVVYDNGKETPAARLFWTLEFAGHGNVAVLDGGLKQWRAEGRPLDALTPRERTVFELRHYEGLRLKAIGDMLGTTEEAAKNCLFRATQKMRMNLEAFV